MSVWQEFETFDRMGAEAADLLEAYESAWDVKHLRALRAIVES